jgi:hypothetical protein
MHVKHPSLAAWLKSRGRLGREGFSSEIEAISHRDAGCERLMSVPGHRADHLQRDGGCDWRWGCVRKGPRLRRLAGARPQADLDWGPHDPRQDIEAWQSLPARPVRPGGVGYVDQAKELGVPRAQAPWLEADSGRVDASQRTRRSGRALDRAGLLLHWLHLLHYANYRFFFFAKITFQLSL